MNARMLGLMAIVLALASHAEAQRPEDPRLTARLDPASRSAVAPIIAAGQRDGVPTEPLVQKALEGARKGAPPERIAAALRTLERELVDARAVLGTPATEAEIVAGSAALHAGVSTAAIASLREAQPRRQPLTVALGVLTDLIARGVPVDVALAAVRPIVADGGAPEAFERLREETVRALAGGAAPRNAVAGSPGRTSSPPTARGTGRAGRPAPRSHP